MDRQWVIRKLIDEYGLAIEEPGVMKAVVDFAKEIVDEHEREQQTAVEAWSEIWLDISKRLVARIFMHQIRLLMMAKALEPIADVGVVGSAKELSSMTPGLDTGTWVKGDWVFAAREALKHAPVVLFDRVVEVVEASTGDWTAFYDDDGYVGKMNGVLDVDADGRCVHLVITDMRDNK